MLRLDMVSSSTIAKAVLSGIGLPRQLIADYRGFERFMPGH